MFPFCVENKKKRRKSGEKKSSTAKRKDKPALASIRDRPPPVTAASRRPPPQEPVRERETTTSTSKAGIKLTLVNKVSSLQYLHTNFFIVGSFFQDLKLDNVTSCQQKYFKCLSGKENVLSTDIYPKLVESISAKAHFSYLRISL